MSIEIIIPDDQLSAESITDSGFDVSFTSAATRHMLEVTTESYVLDQKDATLVKVLVFNVEKETFSLEAQNIDFTHRIPGDADSAELTAEPVYDITLESAPVYEITLTADPLIE